jgi:hypothetical protein
MDETSKKSLSSSLLINVDLADSLSYVTYQAECEIKRFSGNQKQNTFSFLHRLLITNKTQQDIFNASIEFVFSPSFIQIAPVSLTCLEKNKTTEVNDFDIFVDVKNLYLLCESIPGSLIVNLKNSNGVVIATQIASFAVLPIEESASKNRIDEILASFVTPNDQKVKEVVGEASKIYHEKYGSTSFVGYQFHDPNKVVEQVDAIYVAVCNLGIRYSEPPASFEKTFQRVRLPYTVLKEKTATCLDFSLLFASLFESIGLRPLLVIIEGHALVGVYLDEETFSLPRIDNGTELLNQASKGFNHLLLLNVVDSASTPSTNFSVALEDGYKVLQEAKVFHYALDISSCRKEHLLPLPTPETLEDGTITIAYPFAGDKEEYNLPNINVDERRYIDPNAKSSKTKFDYWEEKLLDLSLRNQLINLHFPISSVQLVNCEAESYLNFLNTNSKVFLLPNDGSMLSMSNDTPIISFSANVCKTMQKEASNKKTLLVVSRNPEKIDDYLKNLSRKSNTAIEESGCNPLFLTLGLIKWYDNEHAASHGTGALYAPIFILPVKMPRHKVGPNYTIEYSFDDLSLNTTIFEYFKQVFHLDFSQISGNMPRLESGQADIRLIYNFIREKISSFKGWSLLEEPSTLALFSFARFVMWNDIRTHREDMLKNSFVASLVSGVPEWHEPANLIGINELDEKLNPTSLAIPLSADSSQIEAIASSSAGASFVLDGPPGTGKSQTIANMITNFLYEGKHVLFVAEKGVALEVVKRRLDELGLGQFCLEIPSVTTAKSDVLTDLGKLLDLGPVEGPSNFGNEAAKLEEDKERLNSTLAKLHQRNDFFISTYDALIGYLELKKYKDAYETDESYARSLTPDTFKESKDAINKLMDEDHLVGGYLHNPFLPFTKEYYSLEERDLCFKELAPLGEIYKDLHRDIYNCFFKDQGLYETRDNVNYFIEILNQLRNNPALFQDYLSDDTFVSLSQDELSFLNLRLEIAQQKVLVMERFDEGVLAVSGEKLIASYDSIPEKPFFKKERYFYKLKRELKPFAKTRKSLSKKSVASLIDSLKVINVNQEKLVSFPPYVKHVFSSLPLDEVESIQSNLDTFNRTIDISRLISKITPALNSTSLDVVAAIKRLASNTGVLFDKAHTILLDDFSKAQALEKTLKEKYGYEINNYSDETNYYLHASSKINDSIAFNGQLSEWGKLLSAMKEVQSLTPANLVQLFKEGKIANVDLLNTYLSSLYFRVLMVSLAKDNLGSLSAKDTDKEIQFYQKNMSEFARLSVLETAKRLTSHYPSSDTNYASSTKTYQLKKFAKNGGRGTSLRKLFSEYAELIKDLCPCFLMSPLAVAQYLDPKLYHFDAVIFDEASQVPTSEAIGAISRGDSLIVAGDQEQMPPSNYFVANVDGNYNDNDFASAGEDLESLLDDAIVIGLPSKQLSWHYRSRHESLIAFSNNKFYHNNLLTFPSPSLELASVSFHFVGGLYEKRRGINRLEAQAIVAEVKRRLHDPKLCKESIGIVTFNEAQQNLIEDYLDKEMLTSNVLASSGEPIFVKNLENVQGDERDVILFSICYAPSKKGEEVSLNFGPLSREKGERRLNVAVSRARESMMVFSSIQPSDIRAERAKNEGASYLRDFLTFAKCGVSSLLNNASNKIVSSSKSIANFLADDLKKLGYQVKLNLGASSFKVDLAIVDPKNAENMLLGVIVDGDSYCAPLTCRDRNIVQPQILKNLGWTIYRVWSVEYLDHPAEVVKNIVSAINGASSSSSPTKVSFGPLELKKKETVAHPNAVRYVLSPDYKMSLDFDSPFVTHALSNYLGQVIEHEYPISRHLLEVRFRTNFKISKIGSNIRNVFNMSLLSLSPFTESCASLEFYWPTSANVEEYRFYRLNNDEVSREITDISFIELGNAFADILTLQGSMSEIDLFKQVSLLFGFASLKEKSRVYLSKALKFNASNRLGIIVEDDIVSIR